MTTGIELYRVASTLFLGLGAATFLQGRLVDPEPSYPIPVLAWKIMTTIDVVLSTMALVLIALGELTVIQVLERGSATEGDRTLTIVLLAVVAGYVVLNGVVKLALPMMWEEKNGEMESNSSAIRRFFRCLLAGVLLGGCVFYAAVVEVDLIISVFVAVVALLIVIVPELRRSRRTT
jgi:hypothetical protein